MGRMDGRVAIVTGGDPDTASPLGQNFTGVVGGRTVDHDHFEVVVVQPLECADRAIEALGSVVGVDDDGNSWLKRHHPTHTEMKSAHLAVVMTFIPLAA